MEQNQLGKKELGIVSSILPKSWKKAALCLAFSTWNGLKNSKQEN